MKQLPQLMPSLLVLPMWLSHFDEKSGVVPCKTEWGRWYQTAQEVTVEVDLEEGTRGKEIQVETRPNFIRCIVRGKELFQVKFSNKQKQGKRAVFYILLLGRALRDDHR